MQGVECKENEYCKVEPQESTDGSWAPPRGVCTDKACAEGDTECLLDGGVLDNLFAEKEDCAAVKCPAPPSPRDGLVCKEFSVSGQCCPNYGCVTANPPFIDVCAVSLPIFFIDQYMAQSNILF